MAIAFESSGAVTYGINSITPVIDAAQTTDAMMLLIVGGKPFDSAWTVSGWTSAGRGQSGTTVAGVDTGSMALEVFWKIAAADPETNPTVTEGTPAWNVVGAWVMTFTKAANETWSTPTAVYGADEVTGTAVSATMSADNNVAVNDFIVTLLATNTDAMGPYPTDITAAQTGVTFANYSTRTDSVSSSGGDMSLNARTANITGGPSSAAAVLTATGAASGGADKSEAGYVRLRVTAAVSGPIIAAHANRMLQSQLSQVW